MTSLSLFGAQWGDEGKGKIIDRLAADADFVVRYQGGPNAGHTVVVGNETFVLHLVPSGILHPGKTNVIANGVAVDPERLLGELDALAERGVEVDARSLRLSALAHVIFEHHRRIDELAERWRGTGRIGTTGRGIGPCYADRAARTGLRVLDLFDRGRLETRLRAALAEKNALIERVHGEAPIEFEAELERAIGWGERLRPYVADTGLELRRAVAEGRRVLFEGAQGIMLDVEHGTYPYVTSSSTGVFGIPAATGLPPSAVGRAIGIAKAYCTRVGEGPFPSEEKGAIGERIREAGREYGATTGRPRRCGWLDVVALRHALELNGADGWILTNLDVLSGFDEIRVVVAYEHEGTRHERYPVLVADLGAVTPIHEARPAWSEDIGGCRALDELPALARDYVEWLEELVGCPIVMISVGAERDQVISRGL